MAPLDPAKVDRSEARQIVKNVLNYPLFVPDLGPRTTRAIVCGDRKALVCELTRLSTLGSGPASALLLYLKLKRALDFNFDGENATAMCRQAAYRGEPYSQYVMGWLCRADGEDVETFEWMRRSAVKGLFLPAMVDIARFMAGGVGVSCDVDSALRVLHDAHKLGHRMALVYIAEHLRRKKGIRGFPARILGYLLYPFALLRATVFTKHHPLSDRIFVTSLIPRLPLFKDDDLCQSVNHYKEKH